MTLREWGAECNGNLPRLSIPSKTATWVPEFSVEDLPLSRTGALVPEFAVQGPYAEYSDDNEYANYKIRENSVPVSLK